MLDSSVRCSSSPLPSKLMQSGCSFSGRRFFSTCNARGVFAVTSIRCHVASKWQIKLAIVCDFPVPGGPCTSTPLAARILPTICRCASFAGLGKKTSPSNSVAGSPDVKVDTASVLERASARSANSPGTAPPFSICSLIRCKVSMRPREDRLRSIRVGANATTGFSEAWTSLVESESMYSPCGLMECTRA